MDSNVYIIKCDDYDDVKNKLPELIGMMGGIEKYAAAGEKIVLKVNLLASARPEEAVTTHPEIVSSTGRMLADINAEGIIADSPGSGLTYNEKTLDEVYRVTGMHKAAEKSGCKVNFDCSYREVPYPGGKLLKRLDVITPVLESDGVFNLCKMKTHLFMRMTGAVKNNFGIIPGLMKPGYHSKLHSTEYFADMLLDLSQYVSPRLTIMDAIIGMEGDGPSAGSPREIGLLIASADQLAVDIVAGEIMGLEAKNNPVLIAAAKRGMKPAGINDVNIIGESLDKIKIRDFRFPSNFKEGTGLVKIPPIISRQTEAFFKSVYSAMPVIDKNACIACGSCVKACPENAISIDKKKNAASIDRKKCIRCYCCHEMCREKAVALKFGLFHGLFAG